MCAYCGGASNKITRIFLTLVLYYNIRRDDDLKRNENGAGLPVYDAFCINIILLVIIAVTSFRPNVLSVGPRTKLNEPDAFPRLVGEFYRFLRDRILNWIYREKKDNV